MRRIMHMLAVCSLMISCQSETEKRLRESKETLAAYEETKVKDSLYRAADRELFQEDKKLSDSLGPIAIIQTDVKKKAPGQRQIVVTLKNRTDRTIDAILVEWRLKDAFGEAVEEPLGAGSSEEVLMPKATKVYRWDIDPTARKAEACVRKAHFADSVSWNLSDAY